MTFDQWWDSDKPDSTNNQYRPDSAVYWAWAGWQAGFEAGERKERERCAKVCDGLTGRSYEFDMGRLNCANEIRKGEAK
jgi:hypothetical protein